MRFPFLLKKHLILLTKISMEDQRKDRDCYSKSEKMEYIKYFTQKTLSKKSLPY